MGGVEVGTDRSSDRDRVKTRRHLDVVKVQLIRQCRCLIGGVDAGGDDPHTDGSQFGGVLKVSQLLTANWSPMLAIQKQRSP